MHGTLCIALLPAGSSDGQIARIRAKLVAALERKLKMPNIKTLERVGRERVLRLQVLGGVWRAQALPWRWTAAQPAPQFNAMRKATMADPAAPGA